MNKVLTVQGVTYQYPGSSWRLSSSSFSLAKGQIKGIIGPNGSGKSTLLKIAASVLSPATGKVAFEGQDLNAISHRKRARLVGYLPQHVQSHFDYIVEEIVAMGRFAHLSGAGFMGPKDIDVVEKCLDQTNTEKLRHRPFSRLSGGEKQRVLLASVLAQEPRVLLLDEPTSAMDIHQQVNFFSMLAKLVVKGMAVVAVTHDLNLASVFFHHLVLMKQGEIMLEGSNDKILNSEILARTYGPGIEVLDHPANGRPVVLPHAPEQEIS